MILAFFAAAGNWFGGVGGWLKNNPVIAKILVVLGVLILLWFGKNRWEANIAKGVRRQEREAFARAQAETKIAVTERQVEIINEERSNADDALRARDTGPVYPDAASVPDEIADVLFRSSRRNRTDPR